MSTLPERETKSVLPGRVSLIALWGIAISGAWLLHHALSGFVFEDSFITYRYASNVAEGAGYVFTPGERVFGATAPLHVLVLALFGALGADIPTCAGILFAACWGAVAVIGGCILRHLNSPIAGLLFALMIMTGSTEVYSYWGLETTMLTALILGSGFSALKGRDNLAGILVGLAFLTRYDAALFAILLFSGLVIHQRRIPWRSGMIATLIVTPWLLFAWQYFGSVLPNTLGAKMGDTTFLHYLRESGITQLSLVWEPLKAQRSIFLMLPTTHFWLNICLGVGILLAVLRLFRGHKMLGLFLAYPLVLWIGYAVICPPLVFHWYLTPGVVSLLLVAFAGLGTLIPERRFQWSRLTVTLVSIACVASLIPDAFERRRHHYMDSAMYQSRVIAYSDIADWIVESELTELSLMTLEPGYLIYKAGNPTIDSAGLVTKGVQFHGDKSKRTSVGQLLRERKPNFIVSRNTWRPRGYALAFSAYPGTNLFLDSRSHSRLFDQLSTSFQDSAETLDPDELLHHPFHLDFDRATRSAWAASDGRSGHLGRDRDLNVKGQALSESVLFIERSLEGAETPPFLIDFDRLSFRFAGTHAKGTVAQLIIGGKVVLERAGATSKTEGVMDFPIHSWPVGHWRGLVATLRFAIPIVSGQWLAADHIRSVKGAESTSLDDFDSEDGYGPQWRKTFGAAPSPLGEVAKLYGVEFAYSPRAAISRGLRGKQEMTSQPFLVEHDLLNFLVLDFCTKNKSIVQLLVKDQVVRRFRPLGDGRLRPVTWDVSDLRGQEVVLHVSDMDKSPNAWIGVDSITLTDE